MNMDALPGFHSAVGGLYLEEKGIHIGLFMVLKLGLKCIPDPLVNVSFASQDVGSISESSWWLLSDDG